ncbi:hypothetical protein [Bacillus wiedmannii]|uniref:hypothetical protein n=1 Tax=Bacillus wiedmannii TaxID=1890302 RepID=UPI000991FAD7|nr:hypothetical protein [Bacillus wiedmannii]OOR27576.1 hypothetical protein BW893_08405 [Bacillus wiedmannii]
MKISEISQDELHILLKKLTDKNLDMVDILGIICSLLYSKSIFKRNQDIEMFLYEVLGMKFLPYVIHSRTLIVARVTKELHKQKDIDIKKLQKSVLNYFNEKDALSSNKVNKKKDENEKLKTWLRGL